MSREEMLKVFYVIKAAYPRYYKELSAKEVEQLIATWGLVFGDYSYEKVSAGVKFYLANDTKGFPPSPGQIVDSIARFAKPVYAGITADEAWGYIAKAVSNSTYNSVEEFNKLPDICKEIVVSPRQLLNWVEDDSFNSVARSNFLKSFREKVQKKEEEEKLPENIKNLISFNRQKMLENKE